MATQLNVRELTANEKAGLGGYTHLAVITPADLSETTTNTAQVFNLAATVAGDTIVKWALIVKTTLQDASDTSFNTNTMSFGDAGSATRFVSAVETNENGTEVIYTYGNTAYTYTAAGQLKWTVNAMSGKALSDIDVGEVILAFEILRHSTIAAAAIGNN